MTTFIKVDAVGVPYFSATEDPTCQVSSRIDHTNNLKLGLITKSFKAYFFLHQVTLTPTPLHCYPASAGGKYPQFRSLINKLPKIV